MDRDDDRNAASATGILGCLRLLAAEALTLGLHQTHNAIAEALAVAGRECGSAPVPEAWQATEHSRTH